MNILCIGDVVGSQGCQFLRAHLPALKRTKAIDLVIANRGKTPRTATASPPPRRNTCWTAVWT